MKICVEYGKNVNTGGGMPIWCAYPVPGVHNTSEREIPVLITCNYRYLRSFLTDYVCFLLFTYMFIIVILFPLLWTKNNRCNRNYTSYTFNDHALLCPHFTHSAQSNVSVKSSRLCLLGDSRKCCRYLFDPQATGRSAPYCSLR